MEYLQVFNKNKEMLNESVLRSEKHNLKDNKYYMVVVIFIENSEGKFLMQKTSVKKGSIIATTGGHVVYKDNGLKTVIKETNEELGLDLSQDKITFVDSYIDDDCFLETYYLKKDIDINDLTLQFDEIESVNWYTVDEIEVLIKNNKFREGNIVPFRRVLDYRK